MSYANFCRAIELAKKCSGFWIAGGKTKEVIFKAEDALKLRFSKQNREYYEMFGSLEFFGKEIFGIEPSDSSGILEGNSVAYALNDRVKYGLPMNWLPICSFDDGLIGYLDYTQLNKYGEPPLIAAFYNGREYVVAAQKSNDLGDFLLGLIKEQLNRQENVP